MTEQWLVAVVPLFYAAQGGHSNALLVLIQQGASLDSQEDWCAISHALFD